MNLDNKEWLYHEYVIKNQGMKAIAKTCGCTLGRVARRLRHFNIPIKSFADGIRNVPKGEKHFNWRGGFYITREDYIKIATPKGHPCRSRYIFLHRLIMEKKLGRYLRPHERVHHKDGNKQNNALENLELFENQSEHAKAGLINARKHQRLWEVGWLEGEYKGRTLTEISNDLNCSEGAVRNALNRLGIKRRRYTLTAKAIEARIKGGHAKKPRIAGSLYSSGMN